MAEKADETQTSPPVSETQAPSPPFGPSSDAAAETLPARGATSSAVSFRTVDDADYDIVGDLAKGGMGRIRHARDRRHGRPVAIKELLKSSSEARQRFRREALITARLQHPAIVPLYEAGAWPNGEPFYSMKLVEGESLDKVIARKSSLTERIALLPRMITVAEAIAYAHDRHIIHRDVKPSNILVGDLGETVVIDWGLAKELGERDVVDVSHIEVDGSGNALTVAGRTGDALVFARAADVPRRMRAHSAFPRRHATDLADLSAEPVPRRRAVGTNRPKPSRPPGRVRACSRTIVVCRSRFPKASIGSPRARRSATTAPSRA